LRHHRKGGDEAERQLDQAFGARRWPAMTIIAQAKAPHDTHRNELPKARGKSAWRCWFGRALLCEVIEEGIGPASHSIHCQNLADYSYNADGR
jgi:hypothetical protein